MTDEPGSAQPGHDQPGDQPGHDEPGYDAAREEGNSSTRAHQVLAYLAGQLVEDAEAVVIEAEASRGGTRLALRVAPGDMGRVIGRRGRLAQAIRTVVRAAATAEGADVTVDIVD